MLLPSLVEQAAQAESALETPPLTIERVVKFQRFRQQLQRWQSFSRHRPAQNRIAAIIEYRCAQRRHMHP